MPTKLQSSAATIAEFEKILSATTAGQYHLRLYLTGSTRRSLHAVETVKDICDRYLKGRYKLEIVDLYQKPDSAKSDQIIAAPTLVKLLPPPLRRLVGDLSKPDRVLIALDLEHGKK